MIKNKLNNYFILGLISFVYLFYITITDSYYLDAGHYIALRWLVFSFAGWTFYKIFQKNKNSFWLLIFAAITIIFNPIIELTLKKNSWHTVDIIVLIVFVIYCLLNLKNKNV